MIALQYFLIIPPSPLPVPPPRFRNPVRSRATMMLRLAFIVQHFALSNLMAILKWNVYTIVISVTVMSPYEEDLRVNSVL